MAIGMVHKVIAVEALRVLFHLAAALIYLCITVVFVLTIHVNRHCRYKARKHGGID